MSDTRRETARPRFLPGEIILSEVTEDDLQSLTEGNYASFPKQWFDSIEPESMRPSHEERVRRLAERTRPWISEPHTRWIKATFAPWSSEFDSSRPDRIIGHAGWLLPGRTGSEILNLFRRDAGEKLGWAAKMGWSKEFEDELWSGIDLQQYQTNRFERWDRLRESYLGGVGHWFLAPLWVLPEYQGRGVASLLLRDGVEMAEKENPVPPMYLEAAKSARPIYERFGFREVEGEGKDIVMIRPAPAVSGSTVQKDDPELSEAKP